MTSLQFFGIKFVAILTNFINQIYSPNFLVKLLYGLFLFGASYLPLKADELFDHKHLTEDFRYLASSKEWLVFADKNPKECWASAQIYFDLRWANKQGQVSGTSNTHGPHAFYSYSERRGSSGELAIYFDLPLKPTAVVRLQINNQKFEMFHNGSWAWIAKKTDDIFVLEALKSTKFADLKIDESGKTLGEFKVPLTGFQTANQLAKKACGNSTLAGLSRPLMEL